jgi:ring-1,2-phenylacetyl-CoA epoxidase subunit PaaD
VSGERELPDRLDRSAWAALETVLDPEVPVLSVVELGIVREVAVTGDRVSVTLTPTYSGCPAMRVIESEIEAALRNAGFTLVELKTVYAPPWTTDWITEPAKQKLRDYGIAPPGPAPVEPLVRLGGPARQAVCPFCGSPNTVLQSEFGATACKSLFTCRSCRQPFEHFKAF